MTTHRPLLAVLLSLSAALTLPSSAWADDKPVPINEKLAAKGETVYLRFCVSCHGLLGDGRGYSHSGSSRGPGTLPPAFSGAGPRPAERFPPMTIC